MRARLPRRRPADDRALHDLLALSYELLDAHVDTIELTAERELGARWDAHLDYVRALQRVGRALVARAHAGATRAHAGDPR